MVGRLTREPELRHTANETPVCNFTLAVDRRFKSENQPTADFIPVVVWRGTAEFVAKYFTKGMRVFTTGRIQTRDWEDADGNKRYVTEVVGDQVGFADGKRGEQNTDKAKAAPPEDDLPF